MKVTKILLRGMGVYGYGGAERSSQGNRGDKLRRKGHLAHARPEPTYGLVLLCLLLAFSQVFAQAAQPKRVLIIHSFGSVSPPFTTESTAFVTELTERQGEAVDLDE